MLLRLKKLENSRERGEPAWITNDNNIMEATRRWKIYYPKGDIGKAGQLEIPLTKHWKMVHKRMQNSNRDKKFD